MGHSGRFFSMIVQTRDLSISCTFSLNSNALENSATVPASNSGPILSLLLSLLVQTFFLEKEIGSFLMKSLSLFHSLSPFFTLSLPFYSLSLPFHASLLISFTLSSPSTLYLPLSISSSRSFFPLSSLSFLCSLSPFLSSLSTSFLFQFHSLH